MINRPKTGQSYPVGIYESLAEYEHKSFWFKTRNEIIRYLLDRFSPHRKNIHFLELGCGTGFVLEFLKHNTLFHLTGADIYLQGLEIARNRIKNVKLIQLDATKFFASERYDIIGMFDVLEHISKDEKVIANSYSALKNNGMLILSVPQHQILWSQNDDIANHKRRYSRKGIISMLERNNFKILFYTSYLFFLFPLLLIIRKIKGLKPEKNSQSPVIDELRIPSFANYILGKITSLDLMLIKLGISLPVGGSLFVAARKIG